VVTSRATEADVLVVGGGMAGTVAALAARAEGARVVLVRRAPGATALSSGGVCVAPDIGAGPGEPLARRRGPLEAARRLAALRPDHPYALLGDGLGRLGEALAFVARALPLLAPPLERSRFLPTAHGTALACALCQRSMEAGDLLAGHARLAVAGLEGHLGTDARLVAAGLARYAALGGPEIREVRLAFPGPALAAARPHELARALEPAGAAEALGERLRAVLPAGTGAVLVPPVLGIDAAARVPERVAAAAGVPVAELAAAVPSVPGARLQAALESALDAAGVERIAADVEATAGPGIPLELGGRRIVARRWVLATGRFVGGGIRRAGSLVEPALGLAVQAAEGREAGVHLAGRPAASLTVRDRRAAQPLLSSGLRVDAALRPLDGRGAPVHEALFAAGAVIGGHEQATDGTGLGVAIVTGYLAGVTAAAGTSLDAARQAPA
jgi:glycerol-3-phosphate dehydrogenase subunit B